MGEADDPLEASLTRVRMGRNPRYSTVQRSNGSVNIGDVEEALDEIEVEVTKAFATIRLRMRALAKPPISGS